MAKNQTATRRDVEKASTEAPGLAIAKKPCIQIPAWVPDAVKSMAAVLPVNGGMVGRRLLTDEGMKSVWVRLQRAKVAQDLIDKLPSRQRLSSFGIPTRKISLEEQACAALFVGAVIELSFNRTVLTRPQIKRWSAQWRATADVCRLIMDNEPGPRADLQLMKAFAIVENYLKDGAQEMEQRNGPYVLPGSSGKKPDDDKLRGGRRDKLRGRVRALAREMHKIYGSFRYETVVEIANIALLPEPEIDKEDVRDWCASLSRH